MYGFVVDFTVWDIAEPFPELDKLVKAVREVASELNIAALQLLLKNYVLSKMKDQLEDVLKEAERIAYNKGYADKQSEIQKVLGLR